MAPTCCGSVRASWRMHQILLFTVQQNAVFLTWTNYRKIFLLLCVYFLKLFWAFLLFVVPFY